MKRAALKYLQEWLLDTRRLPLVMRGARQVGKTWLVRELAEVTGKQLIEINLERQPEVAEAFASNDPKDILHHLQAMLEVDIQPELSILFIDEIQAAPELFAKLRWFAEEMPELPVVTAGSLLEFVLGKYKMSMPVGRITYMYLEPLSFEEFLLAHGRINLVAQLKEFNWDKTIPALTHANLMKLFKEYVTVGGMPAAVQSWVDAKSLPKVSRIHSDILQTYRDDFHKYNERIPAKYLDEVLKAVPQTLGEKFVYSHVNRDVSHTLIKESLELLTQARVCHKVQGTSANGVPLGGELLHQYFKMILLDVGLCSAALKLSLTVDSASNPPKPREEFLSAQKAA